MLGTSQQKEIVLKWKNIMFLLVYKVISKNVKL